MGFRNALVAAQCNPTDPPRCASCGAELVWAGTDTCGMTDVQAYCDTQCPFPPASPSCGDLVRGAVAWTWSGQAGAIDEWSHPVTAANPPATPTVNFSFWGTHSGRADAVGNVTLASAQGGNGSLRVLFIGAKSSDGAPCCSVIMNPDCTRLDFDNGGHYWRVQPPPGSLPPPPLPPVPSCNVTAYWRQSSPVIQQPPMHPVYAYNRWLVVSDLESPGDASFGDMSGAVIQTSMQGGGTVSSDCNAITWTAGKAQMVWTRVATRIPPMPAPPPPPPPPGHCLDDMGCSLLGICTTGMCKCDPGWAGPDCSRADLKPLDLSLGYNNVTDSTWGGRPIKDPATGRWSLLVCQMTKSCPLDYWTTNSLVVRAEAATAAGPFRFAETVYPLFHTNPQVIGPTPDGYYLLFAIGANSDPAAAIDCTKTPIPPPAGGAAGRAAGLISMGYSKGSPTGPWSMLRVVLTNYNNSNVSASDWDCMMSNPSPTLLPNGGVMLVFSSLPCTGPNYGKFGTSLGAAFAPHWNDTYTQSKVMLDFDHFPASC